MNVISLEVNFADFSFVTMLQCTAKMFALFNFAETVPTQNLRNKSHAKFKAFTVFDQDR